MRIQLKGFFQALKTIMLLVVIQRYRIGNTGAGKRQPLLLFQVRDLFSQALAQWVSCFTAEKALIEQAVDIFTLNRAVVFGLSEGASARFICRIYERAYTYVTKGI